MQSDGSYAGKIPAGAGAVRARRTLAALAAALLMAYALGVGIVNSFKEYQIAILWNNGITLPPILVSDVGMVKKIVPKGSIIFYFMQPPPSPQSWQFGMWERSLYPDDILLPVVGSAVLNSPECQALRKRYHVHFMLLNDMSLPGVKIKFKLPNYVNGIQIALAELDN